MESPRVMPTAGGVDAPLLSIYAYRTVDDGRICLWVSHGTVDKPDMPRRFLWDDVESDDSAAAIMAIVSAWVFGHTLNQPLPFD